MTNDSRQAIGPTAPAAARLLVPAAVGAFGALVLVAAIHLLASAAGDDLRVTPPGGASTSVPLAVALVAALVGCGAALAVAAVSQRTRRPRRNVTVLAGVGLALSFAAPFGAADVGTALWLCLMHLGVAVAVVPPLARALPEHVR